MRTRDESAAVSEHDVALVIHCEIVTKLDVPSIHRGPQSTVVKCNTFA
jgi:hypothetical protein